MFSFFFFYRVHILGILNVGPSIYVFVSSSCIMQSHVDYIIIFLTMRMSKMYFSILRSMGFVECIDPK